MDDRTSPSLVHCSDLQQPAAAVRAHEHQHLFHACHAYGIPESVENVIVWNPMPSSALIEFQYYTLNILIC